MEKAQRQGPIRDASILSIPKQGILGLQHTFTMFGATVLVPILTGLDISVALFMSGICTLICHMITKYKVPVYLGSSFAFITPILTAAAYATSNLGASDGLAYAQGGIVVAGLLYLIVSALIFIFGVDKIVKFFPPVVTGPMIIVIGINLAPTAVDMASGNWLLAIVGFAVVVAVSIYTRGFLQIVPVIIGLIVGYIFAIFTGNVDFTPIKEASLFGIPKFTVAKFDLNCIMMVAPVAIATIIEHIGDIVAIGSTVEEDFLEEPGLHRTMFADGFCTSLSAMFGGPANTTYSENTGVLALTKVWDPKIMRIAAVFAILLGGIPKLSAIIQTIPVPLVGGISIILFGMIAGTGIRSIVENKIDYTQSKNLIITASILVLALGGASIPIGDNFTLSGMALAAIVGIILNIVLKAPEGKTSKAE